EIGCQTRQTILVVVRPAILDRDVLALDKSGFVQTLPKRVNKMRRTGCRRISEKSDHRHRCLLRARREGPRCRATEKRDELPSPHSISSSARGSSVGGISRPSALAVLRLMTSSYLVGACTGRSAGFSPLRMRST